MTPFDWRTYLTLAEELATRANDDAAYRAAISRSYYAAFGTARAYLIATGVHVPAAGHAHSFIWDRFHLGPDPVHRRIADLGRRLRRRRGFADYDARYEDAATDLAATLRMARQVITDLDGLAP